MAQEPEIYEEHLFQPTVPEVFNAFKEYVATHPIPPSFLEHLQEDRLPFYWQNMVPAGSKVAVAGSPKTLSDFGVGPSQGRLQPPPPPPSGRTSQSGSLPREARHPPSPGRTRQSESPRRDAGQPQPPLPPPGRTRQSGSPPRKARQPPPSPGRTSQSESPRRDAGQQQPPLPPPGRTRQSGSPPRKARQPPLPPPVFGRKSQSGSGSPRIEGYNRHDGGRNGSHGRGRRSGRSHDRNLSRSPRDRKRRSHERDRSRSPRERSRHRERGWTRSPPRRREGEREDRRTSPPARSDSRRQRPPTPSSPDDVFKTILFDEEFNNMLNQPIEPLPPEMFNSMDRTKAKNLCADYHDQVQAEGKIYEKLLRSSGMALTSIGEQNKLDSKEKRIIDGFPSIKSMNDILSDITKKETNMLAETVDAFKSIQNTGDPNKIIQFDSKLLESQSSLEKVTEQQQKLIGQREDLNGRRIKMAADFFETVKASKEAEDKFIRGHARVQRDVKDELKAARTKRAKVQQDLKSAISELRNTDPSLDPDNP